MPAAVVKKISKKLGIPIKKIEKYWNIAKKACVKRFGKEKYQYIIGILKRMLGKEKVKKLGWKWTAGTKEFNLLVREMINKDRAKLVSQNIIKIYDKLYNKACINRVKHSNMQFISACIIEAAKESDWFYKLSKKEREEYIKKHPNSKYAKKLNKNIAKKTNKKKKKKSSKKNVTKAKRIIRRNKKALKRARKLIAEKPEKVLTKKNIKHAAKVLNRPEEEVENEMRESLKRYEEKRKTFSNEDEEDDYIEKSIESSCRDIEDTEDKERKTFRGFLKEVSLDVLRYVKDNPAILLLFL